MFLPDEGDRAGSPGDRFSALTTRWRRWVATPVGANVSAVAQALLYLALIILVAWLWGAPEADFRYWGF